MNNTQVTTNKRYKITSHDGKAYIIREHSGVTPVFVYRGFLKDNVFKLYPLRSMRRGEQTLKNYKSAGRVYCRRRTAPTEIIIKAQGGDT